MDYDRSHIPAGYDAGRGYSPEVLSMWLDVIAECAPPGVANILDLGCGTGRYSGALAEHFAARVAALDPSQKMLIQARAKRAPRVWYARACGEWLPLRDACVDMVFMSMIFHHLKDPHQTLVDCRRVLGPGGVACLRTGTTDRIEAYAYVPFFECSRSILKRTLPSERQIALAFQAAGFELMRHRLVQSETASSWYDYANKIAQRADSILAQLSDCEFEDGLHKLRQYCRTAPNEAVSEPVDFFCFRRV
jgi:SAM-dependent methyltransferase